MGNKNFRVPAASKATSIKAPAAAGRTTAAHPQAPAVKRFIKVNICHHDGSIIMRGVDITALRRYSKEARSQLPPNNTTTVPSEATVDFKLPEYIGYSMVTDEAVLTVTKSLMQHRRDKAIPRLPKESLDGEGLAHLINVYALFRAVGVPFSLFPLEKQICRMIRERPITAPELAACWQLLDDSHERIISTAVQSLTFFYLKNKIDEDENKAIEAYCSHEKELMGLFNFEMSRQLDLRRHRRREAKGKAPQEIDW